MVEFAVVVPILLIIVFGISELGRALYQHNTLGKSIDSASRYMSRAYGAVDTTDCSEVNILWDAAEEVAKNIAVYGNENGSGRSLLKGLSSSEINISIESRNVTGTPDSVCVILVGARVAFVGVFGDSVVPFMSLGPINLSAIREVRYIGE